MLSAAVLLLAFWPGLSLEAHRSLVFATLLIAGGALVWLNGDRRSTWTQFGGLIGLGLWLLIQLVPGLNGLLRLMPLPGWPPVALLSCV